MLQLALFSITVEVFEDEKGVALVQWLVLWDGTRHHMETVLL